MKVCECNAENCKAHEGEVECWNAAEWRIEYDDAIPVPQFNVCTYCHEDMLQTEAGTFNSTKLKGE